MAEKMANAPVYYVVAQAGFNVVAKMDDYIPSIQDAFRKRGYTSFDDHEGVAIDVMGSGEVQSKPFRSWSFTDREGRSGFVVRPSSILFHTTEYETRGEFLPRLGEGLAIVHEAVSLERVVQIGLRYLDAILPKPNESPNAYIVPSLHGVELPGASANYQVHEAVFPLVPTAPVTENVLVSRVHWRNDVVGFPPDLHLPYTLTLAERFLLWESRPHAVIDTDHFIKGNFPADHTTITTELRQLHSMILRIFNTVTTEYARTIWRGGEVL